MNWITCSECEEEFRVISDGIEPVAYCPFCSADVVDSNLEETEEPDE